MAAAPVTGSERLLALDLIRGVAVLGIVFANIVAFAQPQAVYVWPNAMPGGATTTDKLFWLIEYVFVDHKMRGLFTILFGAGIVLFMDKARAQGRGVGLQVRRLLWLLLFGALHYYLLWDGDILQSYAVWGLVALLAIRRSSDDLLALGLALYAAGTLAGMVVDGGQYYAATHPQEAAAIFSPAYAEAVAQAESETLKDTAEEIARVASAGYGETVTYRLVEETQANVELIATGVIETIALILIGMGTYRAGFFTGAIAAETMRKWGWAGFIVGAVLSLASGLWAWAGGFPLYRTLFVFDGLMMVPRLAYCLGLAALLVVWTPAIAASALGRRLIAAGRVAFSNYIGTSLVMLAIFPSWGLGMFGKLHRLEQFGIVLLVWMLMLLWSQAWLARYRYGPLEWLWRCLTYGRLFPLRRGG